MTKLHGPLSLITEIGLVTGDDRKTLANIFVVYFFRVHSIVFVDHRWITFATLGVLRRSSWEFRR